MPNTTDHSDMDPHPHRKKVNFDPTINLGHVLTVIAFVASGSVAYFDLRERISNNEIRTQAVADEVVAEKVRNQQALLQVRDDVRYVRDDVREVRNGVNELLRSTNRGK